MYTYTHVFECIHISLSLYIYIYIIDLSLSLLRSTLLASDAGGVKLLLSPVPDGRLKAGRKLEV